MSKINTDTQNKLNSIKNTKEQIRQAINTLNGSEVLDTSAAFSEYANSIGVNVPKTYTVRINETSNQGTYLTEVDYVDDAIGMTPGYDGWKDTELIQSIKPCVLREDGTVNYYLNRDNYTLKEDGSPSVLTGEDGDVMVEIPLMGYKIYETREPNKDPNIIGDTIIYKNISITTDPNREKDGYCYYAHSLDNEKDCDKIYIGAYLFTLNQSELNASEISQKMVSVSNYKLNNNSITSNPYTKLQKSAALKKQKGYSFLTLYPLTLLQILYLIIYKNIFSKNTMGEGIANNLIITGTMNKEKFNSNILSDGQLKFLGLENFYTNNLFSTPIDKLHNNSKENEEIENLLINLSYSVPKDAQKNEIVRIGNDNKSGLLPDSITGVNSQSYGTAIGEEDDTLFFGFNGIFSIADFDFSTKKIASRLMYKHQRPESAPPPMKHKVKHIAYTGDLIETKEFYPGEIVELSQLCKEITSTGADFEYAVINVLQFSFIENKPLDNNYYYCKFIMPNYDIEVKLVEGNL